MSRLTEIDRRPKLDVTTENQDQPPVISRIVRRISKVRKRLRISRPTAEQETEENRKPLIYSYGR